MVQIKRKLRLKSKERDAPEETPQEWLEKQAENTGSFTKNAFDFSDHVVIDEDDLENESKSCPILITKTIAEMSRKGRIADRFKTEFEMMQAEITEDVKSNPTKYNLPEGKSPSEHLLKNIWPTQLKWIQAKYRMDMSKRDFDEWQAYYEAAKDKSIQVGRLLKARESNYGD